MTPLDMFLYVVILCGVAPFTLIFCSLLALVVWDKVVLWQSRPRKTKRNRLPDSEVEWEEAMGEARAWLKEEIKAEISRQYKEEDAHE